MEIVNLKNFLLIFLYSYFIIIIYKIIFNQDHSDVVEVLEEENRRLLFINDGLEQENQKLNEEVAFQLKQIDSLNNSDFENLNQKLTKDLDDMRKIKGQLESDIETVKNENTQLKSNLNTVSENLKKKDDELMKLSRKSKNQAKQIENLKMESQEPTLAYEKHRRRVLKNIILFWDYFTNRTEEILKMSSQDSINEFVSDFYEATRQNKIFWLHDLEQMRINDGYENWRLKESKELSEMIHRRFTKLQNPDSCDTAGIVKCYPYYWAGWGVTIHHVAECLIIGHQLDRTMVFDSTNLQYNQTAGFTEILEPFSGTCTKTPRGEPEEYYKGNLTAFNLEPHRRIVYLDEKTRYKSDNYSARRIPADLAPRLNKLSSNPLAWFNAQLLNYSIHYTSMVRDLVEEQMKKFEIKFPIVGVQVRRTDRLAKERWVPLERYMDFVEDYYDQLELTEPVEKRRVFFASESPNLIPELKSKYPDYEFKTNDEAAKMGEYSKTRFTTKGLLGIIVDLHILSMCNYSVCTESSNVCRLLHEYHQLKHPDTLNRHKSLDTMYFADYENDRFGTAVLSHSPTSLLEIELQVGDPLTLTYTYNQNGMYQVLNGRTKAKGLVPAFKVEISTDTFEGPPFE